MVLDYTITVIEDSVGVPLAAAPDRSSVYQTLIWVTAAFLIIAVIIFALVRYMLKCRMLYRRLNLLGVDVETMSFTKRYSYRYLTELISDKENEMTDLEAPRLFS